jgi:hypothetical protein
MLAFLLSASVVFIVLAYGSMSSGRFGLIVHRPYNNRYNDAPGAREDHCG